MAQAAEKTLNMETVHCGGVDVPVTVRGQKVHAHHVYVGNSGKPKVSFEITHHEGGKKPTVKKMKSV